MFLTCRGDMSNSSASGSKQIPSSNRRFNIALSRSEKIHSSISAAISLRDLFLKSISITILSASMHRPMHRYISRTLQGSHLLIFLLFCPCVPSPLHVPQTEYILICPMPSAPLHVYFRICNKLTLKFFELCNSFSILL